MANINNNYYSNYYDSNGNKYFFRLSLCLFFKLSPFM